MLVLIMEIAKAAMCLPIFIVNTVKNFQNKDLHCCLQYNQQNSYQSTTIGSLKELWDCLSLFKFLYIYSLKATMLIIIVEHAGGDCKTAKIHAIHWCSCYCMTNAISRASGNDCLSDVFMCNASSSRKGNLSCIHRKRMLAVRDGNVW